MQRSTHYYVLSLTNDRAVLYEAFRDALTFVENRGFPVVAATRGAAVSRAHMRVVDDCFDSHYRAQPLGLVVVGESKYQHSFELESNHAAAVVGRIFGDRSDAHAGDLGQIVWPVVKDELSGLLEDARCELEACTRRGDEVHGLGPVAAAVTSGVRGKLLVEDDYFVRGRLATDSPGQPISLEVDIRDTIDDAVDAVIERVLEMGGHVVFMPSGALEEYGRVVLLPKKVSEK